MYWVERIFDDWLIMSKNPKTTMFYHQICQFRLLKSNINRIFNYCHRIMKNQQLLFKKSHGIINYLKVRLYPIIHLLGTSNPWQLEFSADGALWQYFLTKLLWDQKVRKRILQQFFFVSPATYQTQICIFSLKIHLQTKEKEYTDVKFVKESSDSIPILLPISEYLIVRVGLIEADWSQGQNDWF